MAKGNGRCEWSSSRESSRPCVLASQHRDKRYGWLRSLLTKVAYVLLLEAGAVGQLDKHFRAPRRRCAPVSGLQYVDQEQGGSRHDFALAGQNSGRREGRAI